MKTYYQFKVINKDNRQLDKSKLFNTYEEAKINMFLEHESFCNLLKKDSTIFDIDSNIDYYNNIAYISYKYLTKRTNDVTTIKWKWIIKEFNINKENKIKGELLCHL